MATLTEKARQFGFLISEAPGHISRDAATVVVPAGETFGPGYVLGEVTATGKLTSFDDEAEDGSETAEALLCAEIDNSEGETSLEVEGVTIVNFCAEVAADALLTKSGVALIDAVPHLAAKGIKVRGYVIA